MRRNFWRLLLVVFIVVWALYELYPPKSRNLIQVFQEQAEATDTNFTAIVHKALALEQQNTNQTPFHDLVTAIGTNSLARYFPSLVNPEATDQNRAILNQLQIKAAGRIKLGLDLQGGVQFLVKLDTSKLSNNSDYKHAVQQAIEVLRRRVDRFGVAEPLFQPVGQDEILIQLPGMTEAEKDSAEATIKKAAFLEFRLVNPKSAELLKQGIIEPGYTNMTMMARQEPGKGPIPPQHYLVKTTTEEGLTGKYVTRAGVFPNPVTGQPEISLQFNSEGARIFGDITRKNVGHQLAIVLDGQLYSAPVIQEPILGGNCEINGDFTLTQAYELANVLQNPLSVPVHIEAIRSVDPSLGRDSIQSGLNAAIIGTLAVTLFMLVYYLFAGVVANIAMLLNIVILFGVMCSIDTTLTLPGIAGIVLTIGMAVDANVLIYERIREELAAGKSIRGAVDAGYDKAFSTIFDSNLTTLISSVILIFMGSGPVKGFGVTLTIGVTVSLFTSLVVTRLVFDWVLARGWLKSLPMLHLIRGAKIPFMKYALPAFIASWTLILVGNGYGLIVRGKQAFAVDFRGGDQLVLNYAKKVPSEQIRHLLDGMGLGDAMIQYERDLSSGRDTLNLVTTTGSGGRVNAALQKNFPAAGFHEISMNQVGGTVSQETQKTAIVASLLSMFGILVYVAFRYEFSFAVGAVLAILHDVFMTLGCYFLTGLIPGFEKQFNATVIAAVLTIIGFSINDTIVIFDRIREDLKLGIRGSFREVMEKALNQTLSRTIITSGTVFLATTALFLFGGGAINDFAYTFLIGILTGTYSSIYIASALVLWWHKGQRPAIGSKVVVQEVEPATQQARA